MTEVPPGWTATTLGQLGRYLNGRGFKKTEWSDHGRPIIRIQNLTGSTQVVNRYAGDLDERHVVRPGDLLVSWAATLGAYIWNGEEGALNQHIFKVESRIDRKFHKYLLDHKLSALMRQTHGSGMVHITRSRFDNVPVAVPDPDEQRRIVEILEDHLSRLDAANDYLDAAEVRAAGLIDAVLAGAPELEGCPDVSLSAVLAAPLSNGRSVPTRAGGFPVLRLTALRDEDVDLSERKAGAWTAADAERFLVQRGDVFASRGNGSLHLVGRAAAVREDPDPVAFPDTMIRIRPDNAVIDSDYLVVVWNSRGTRRQIERTARTTAGIYKVNQRDLEAIHLPVPSLPQQKAIRMRVAELRASTLTAAGAVDDARQRSAQLRRALLSAAFSGRLTGHSSDLDLAEEMALA